MKFYLIFANIIATFYLGGGIVLGLAYSFKTEWTKELRGLRDIWMKFSLFWMLLFLPVYFWRVQIFHWHELHGHKAIWFQWSFILARLAFYFGAGLGAQYLLARRPYASLILYFIIGNLFSYDWAMSLDPHWFSNMYGFIYLANGVVGGFALFMLLKFRSSSENARMDLSHLLITSTIVWLYLTLCQFIIIWMGNLPREVSWYLNRSAVLFVALLAFKTVPLLAIAFWRERKLSQTWIRPVALASLLGVILEVIWTLLPGGHI